MAKRRQVVPVTLTPGQRERLERLWFYYGNYGPKTTPGNHSFIQRLLENGIDERPLHTKRTPKSAIPTPECMKEVESILATHDASSSVEPARASHLQAVSNPAKHKTHGLDPETKAIPDDMNRRYRVNRERSEPEDDSPDAA